MESKDLYTITVLVLAVGVLAYMYVKNPTQFKIDIKNPKQGGWAAGVVLFVLALTLPVQVFGDDKGDWFAFTELYIGLDQTKSKSPQCNGGGYSDRITSHGGVTQNIWTKSNRFEFNAKYTHHSCAMNSDRNVYDGVGLEAVYRWNHK